MDQLGHQQHTLGWIHTFVLLSKRMTLRAWSINFYWILTWDRNFLRLFLFCNRIPDPGWILTLYVAEHDLELLTLPTLIPGCWGYKHELPISVCGWLEIEARTSSMQSKHSTKGTTLLGPHFKNITFKYVLQNLNLFGLRNFSCYS